MPLKNWYFRIGIVFAVALLFLVLVSVSSEEGIGLTALSCAVVSVTGLILSKKPN